MIKKPEDIPDIQNTRLLNCTLSVISEAPVMSAGLVLTKTTGKKPGDGEPYLSLVAQFILN